MPSGSLKVSRVSSAWLTGHSVNSSKASVVPRDLMALVVRGDVIAKGRAVINWSLDPPGQAATDTGFTVMLAIVRQLVVWKVGSTSVVSTRECDYLNG